MNKVNWKLSIDDLDEKDTKKSHQEIYTERGTKTLSGGADQDAKAP